MSTNSRLSDVYAEVIRQTIDEHIGTLPRVDYEVAPMMFPQQTSPGQMSLVQGWMILLVSPSGAPAKNGVEPMVGDLRQVIEAWMNVEGIPRIVIEMLNGIRRKRNNAMHLSNGGLIIPGS